MGDGHELATTGDAVRSSSASHVPATCLPKHGGAGCVISGTGGGSGARRGAAERVSAGADDVRRARARGSGAQPMRKACGRSS